MRQEAGWVPELSESLYLIHKYEAEELTEWHGRASETSKLTPVAHLLQQGHISYSFPNSSVDWGPNIETYQLKGATYPSSFKRPQGLT